MSSPEYVAVTLHLAKKLKEASPKQYMAVFHVMSAGQRDCLKRSSSQPQTRSSWSWNDPSFVKLPISSQNTIRVVDLEKKDRVVVVHPKWEIIQEHLTNIQCSFCLAPDIKHVEYGKLMKKTISKYQFAKARGYNFQLLDDPGIAEKLKVCLPFIVKHALDLETRLAKPIPILESGRSQTLLLSRNLCCSLLANAFFCTFPEESRGNLPDFNFFRLFHKVENDARSIVKVEKLKCILEYFCQMRDSNHDKNTVISFERRCVTEHVQWKESNAKLCPVVVKRKSGIEDAEGMLQVDFANKVIGGGVLNDGAVMEEIRFVTSPELIVARLFTEPLNHQEVLVVTGTRKFSSYSGYSAAFQFGGPCPLETRNIDDLGREVTQVVAMDAYPFHECNKWEQYSQEMIDRELHKCFVAFRKAKGNPQAVATGNWGCGAFNGDPELKFLIQWMAASEVKRSRMFYHTCFNDKQSKELKDINEFLIQTEVTVGKLYRCLLSYKEGGKVKSRSRIPIFPYIKDRIVLGALFANK
ncbi:unnamed protein product [Orchesella dallaii]|uniref:poly(ADP-ribose) glycohydrolase n=1 Tax=Orchesella dallaii TaxID=48710 RepID=A0ABP1Q7Q4_9HEXA